MNLRTRMADAIVGVIVSNIKLEDAILLCALRAKQENKQSLATELEHLSKEDKK